MLATSALEIQEISLPFIGQTWLNMNNHIALNFSLGNQGKFYIRASTSCYPYVILQDEWGMCD